MSKIYAREVVKCIECPYFIRLSEKLTIDFRSGFICKLSERHIPKKLLNEIPEWCFLEDIKK